MGSRCSLRKRVINTATSIGTAALSSLLLLGAAGCDKKSGPAEGQQPATNAPAQAAAVSSRAEASLRIHWIGKQHIEADTNAAYLTSIWKAPESQKLEAEVLDKLSVAPWRVNSTNLEESLLAHPASRLFRPLLGDLLNDEFYLELTPRTNGPAEASLALRIAGAQAGVWKANLLAALEELGGREDGAPPAGIDWRVAMTNPSLRDVTFQLAHAGDWTIVSAGPKENTLFMEMLHRAQTEGAPWSRINSWRITGANGNPVPAAKPEPTDPWLQLRADLADFPIFSNALPLLAGNIPRIEISVTGDGKNVRSHAELEFPKPLDLKLAPWRIPTNLVHSALIGFTAVRGFQSLLASWKPWQNNQLGEAPNQAYFWAQEGMPSWHFMAAPSPDATNQIRKLSALVLKDVNPILETNKPKFGTFVPAPGGLGLAWHGIPWFSPHLSPAATGGMPFIFAGFSPVRSTNRPAPPELWPQIYGPSNLVYYDWELTGPCVDGMSQMAQMLRIVFDRARLTHSSGLVWLKALEPKLGNATSAIFQLSPTHLSFTRSSSVGFTDPELQVIMDWLESPSFPIGLHTFVAPPPPPPMTHPRGGASVPASRRPGGASVPASRRGPGGASGGQVGASRSNPSGGTPIARPGFRPPPRIPTTRSGTNG